MYFVGVDAYIGPCHSERSETEPKNLRIIFLAQQTLGAKILRLPPIAQDDILFRGAAGDAFYGSMWASTPTGSNGVR